MHREHTHDEWLRNKKQREINEIFEAKRIAYLRAERLKKKAEREKQYEIAARNPHTLWIFKERERRDAERKKAMFKPQPMP